MRRDVVRKDHGRGVLCQELRCALHLGVRGRWTPQSACMCFPQSASSILVKCSISMRCTKPYVRDDHMTLNPGRVQLAADMLFEERSDAVDCTPATLPMHACVRGGHARSRRSMHVYICTPAVAHARVTIAHGVSRWTSGTPHAGRVDTNFVGLIDHLRLRNYRSCPYVYHTYVNCDWTSATRTRANV